LGGAYDAPDYEDCTVERQKSLFIVGIPLYGPTGGVKCVAEGEFKRDKTFAIAQLWMEQTFAGRMPGRARLVSTFLSNPHTVQRRIEVSTFEGESSVWQLLLTQ